MVFLSSTTVSGDLSSPAPEKEEVGVDKTELSPIPSRAIPQSTPPRPSKDDFKGAILYVMTQVDRTRLEVKESSVAVKDIRSALQDLVHSLAAQSEVNLPQRAPPAARARRGGRSRSCRRVIATAK